MALPAGAVGFAVWVETQGIGLLNLGLLPFWLAVPVAAVLLDLAIYAQHVVFHHVPALWRLHRVHHADTELDVTTGIRFHPLEIGLSILIKLAVIALLGAPAIAVLIFEVLLNAGAMFSHANLKLPESVERRLSWLIVTPGMHRVHHSAERIDTDSNYGSISRSGTGFSAPSGLNPCQARRMSCSASPNGANRASKGSTG